jgi:hypothetical protein
MRSAVSLSLDLLFDEKIVVFGGIVKDNMGLLVAGSAHIGSKHDLVVSVSTELGLVHVSEELDVSTTAVKVLLMLHLELEDQVLVLISESLRHLGGKAVMLGILRGLDTLVSGITIPLTSGVLPCTHFTLRLPVGRYSPAITPVIIIEIFLEIDLARDGSGQSGGDKSSVVDHFDV